MFSPRDPVYVFHHIPKCGGTSIKSILNSWFITISDYWSGKTDDFAKIVDLNSLWSCHCLCGHFEVDGYYLNQRYPEVFTHDRYRVLTFVRDPLQVQLSLFRFEKMSNRPNAKNIEEHLSLRHNYIANRFPATFDNYREVIDRYFFVGILEKSQESMDILASMISKSPKPLQWKNRSNNGAKNSVSTENIPQDVLTQFRKDNALDYLIYDYCVEKFEKRSTENDSIHHGYSATNGVNL